MNMQYPHLGLQAPCGEYAVPLNRTHIVYHTHRLKACTKTTLKGGAASLHSERQYKPSVTDFSDREKPFKINPVAQRISRVAKK